MIVNIVFGFFGIGRGGYFVQELSTLLAGGILYVVKAWTLQQLQDEAYGCQSLLAVHYFPLSVQKALHFAQVVGLAYLVQQLFVRRFSDDHQWLQAVDAGIFLLAEFKNVVEQVFYLLSGPSISPLIVGDEEC